MQNLTKIPFDSLQRVSKAESPEFDNNLTTFESINYFLELFYMNTDDLVLIFLGTINIEP